MSLQATVGNESASSGLEKQRDGTRGTPIYRRRWFPYAVFLAFLLLLSSTSFFNFLLFHSLAETFGAAASFTIAAVVLTSRGSIENNYLRILGVSYLFTAVIEMLHMLAYQGMGVFPDGANLPTQLWLALRYVQAFTLLIAPLAIGRGLSWRWMILGYTMITSVILSTIFLGVFPSAYVPPTGLTPFKIVSEYAIIVLAVSGGVLLYLRRSWFDRNVHQNLLLAVLMFILAELVFTLYIGVYSAVNMLGHLFMLAEFFLVFMAIVHTGIVEPTRLLYRELADRERSFRGIVENVRDVLFQYQLYPEMRLTYISPVVEEITGYPPEDYYRGRNGARGVHPLGGWVPEDSIDTEHDRSMRTFHASRRDGEAIWLQVSTATVRDDEGRAVMMIGIARDVTEIVRNVERLELAQNKLKLLGSLSYHDMQNHITSAVGYMELARRTKDEVKKAEYLDKSKAAIEEINILLGSTHRYYELGKVPPVWLDLRETIVMALSSLDLHGLNVVMDVPELELYADETMVHVFHNLAHNTLKHGTGATEVRIHVMRDDGELSIVFEDDGPGIPMEDKEAIFEWGYRSRRGHGLHYVTEVLAATGMRIRETGEPGKGVRFEILVPRGRWRFKSDTA